MNNDIAIKLEGVGKSFQIYDKPHHRLMQGLLRGNKQFFREFKALEDISFEVQRGETVGIIGRNGTGKSTLLQIICGTMAQSTGSLQVNGRIAAVLELGSGFNPEFTGRENVFVNGAIQGLSHKEIASRFDEIADFANIGDFIDQPVKTYSSGMFVRLAFAVAVCVDPDILVIDEALAVGDVKFQAKCFKHFEYLVSRGTTILFVTHSTEQIVRHCSWSILLEAGRLVQKGPSIDVSNAYMDLLFGSEKVQESSHSKDGRKKSSKSDQLLTGRFEDRETYNPDEYRWGSKQAEIVDYMVTRDGQENAIVLRGGEPFRVIIKVVFHSRVQHPIFGLRIKTPDGVLVYANNYKDLNRDENYKAAETGDEFEVTYTIEQRLTSGDYFISVGAATIDDGEFVPLDRRDDSISLRIESECKATGLANLDMSIDVEYLNSDLEE